MDIPRKLTPVGANEMSNRVIANVDLTSRASQPLSLFSLGCILSVTTLGVALQVSHGFFHPKALIVLTGSIIMVSVTLALPRFTLLVPVKRPLLLRRVFLAALAIYFVCGVIFLHLKHPSIDVLILESDSEYSLVHGLDPYGKDVSHKDIYSPEQKYYGPGIEVNGRLMVGFPYPPLTLFWILPGYIAGDVRYSFLLAVVLTAAMIFYVNPNLNGFLSALLLLLVSDSFYVLSFGWTEPLMVMTLAATVCCARRFPRWLPFALGLFLASKQYSILAVPLVAFLLPRWSWKAYLLLITKAAAIATLTILPFLLWDPQGLWWNLVGLRIVTPLRLDALSFSALMGRHNHAAIPQWLVMAAVVAAITYCMKKAPKTPAGFAVSLGLVSLVFFILNIQAFCNYYFFCACALCLGLSETPYDTQGKFLAVVEIPHGSNGTLVRKSLGLT